MIRRQLAVALVLGLLSVGLAAYGLAFPQQPASSLSVLALREGEGNAILITCDGESLLLPLGGEADENDLAEYLRRRRLRIGRVVLDGQAPLSAALTEQLQDAERYDGGSDPLCVSLGEAECRIEWAEAGERTVAVTHGDNRLLLRLPTDAFPEAAMNRETPVVLQTDRHSVRIFSNGARFTVRPDLTVWDY